MAFADEIGIDLGTATVLIYIKGKGIVLNEPSIVAVNRDTGEILAIGRDAKGMLGRTPSNIIAVRPLVDGVISDYNSTERMLNHFIKKACGARRFFKPKIVISIPSGATEVEKRAVREAAIQAGAKAVYFIEEPMAAAMGAGLDISKPEGTMIVDIGGGSTDIAVMSMNSVIASRSVKVAGDKIDEAIVQYMRKEHKLYIGEKTAEQLKMKVGTAYPRDVDLSMICRGRDLVTGFPEAVEITSSDLQGAIEQPLTAICKTIHEVLEIVPPELAADIGCGRIYLSGGGALLHNVDKMMKAKIGIRVTIAENPMECVVIGTAKALECIAKLGLDDRASRNRKPY